MKKKLFIGALGKQEFIKMKNVTICFSVLLWSQCIFVMEPERNGNILVLQSQMQHLIKTVENMHNNPRSIISTALPVIIHYGMYYGGVSAIAWYSMRKISQFFKEKDTLSSGRKKHAKNKIDQRAAHYKNIIENLKKEWINEFQNRDGEEEKLFKKCIEKYKLCNNDIEKAARNLKCAKDRVFNFEQLTDQNIEKISNQLNNLNAIVRLINNNIQNATTSISGTRLEHEKNDKSINHLSKRINNLNKDIGDISKYINNNDEKLDRAIEDVKDCRQRIGNINRILKELTSADESLSSPPSDSPAYLLT